jgi:branched-chain amino acid transport system ATP-binding protein
MLQSVGFSPGAGKTTLLRAVSRTVATTGGIVFDGVDLTRQAPPSVAALGIGHVPGGRGTFTDLTARENLRLGLSGRRDARTARRRDLDLIVSTFPVLADQLDRPAGQLSGGQQQMLALGRALLARPRLLLVDEPSLGLAPMVVRSLYDTLRHLQATWGLAVVLAEQNARLCLDLADRAYVLTGGRVALSAPAASLGLTELHRAYLGGAAVPAEVAR